LQRLVFKHTTSEIPKIYLAKWAEETHFNKFEKMFLLPFEDGYTFFDKPLSYSVKSGSVNKSYYGIFERIEELPNIHQKNILSKKLIPRYTLKQYIEKVNYLKQQIKLGNIYEINFCFDFFISGVEINPQYLFNSLNSIAQAPFSALVQWENNYILVASPERFLKKTGNQLIAQPMKGTRKLTGSTKEDIIVCNELKNNPKEQNENVMIVDLVRNDLSRIANRRSVNVQELFGVYNYNQVAQMISTVNCTINPQTTLEEILYANFPMGSMTGAPKPKALELINTIEATQRGYYSGTLGFVDENGNFDSCVIIRSIFYNQLNKHLSFCVGSAITDMCNPEEEYNECLLKAQNMLKALYEN